MARGVVKSAAEQSLLRHVQRHKTRLVKITQELVRIRSVNPPGDERDVAEAVRSRLSELGLHTQLPARSPNRPNVLATVKGSGGGQTLLFNGHMDVVPVGDISTWTDDPFSGRVKSGRIFGRGSSDMKGALACIIAALNAVTDSGLGLKGNVVFHAVSDEEAGANYGTKFLVSKGYANADYAVVAEGSVFSSEIFLRPAVRGSCWVRLETFGQAAHASNPKAGVNAVLQMSRLLLALRKLELKHRPHYILPPPTISPGTTIRGGEKVNIIPDRCTAEVDVRTIPGMTEQEVLGQIGQVIESLSRSRREFKAKATIISTSQPAEIPRNSRIIKVAKNATRTVTGYIPEFRAGYGSNDSTYLINQAKIPTICGFGPGDHEQGNAHGPDENVSIESLESFSKIYALMCAGVCGYSSRR